MKYLFEKSFYILFFLFFSIIINAQEYGVFELINSQSTIKQINDKSEFYDLAFNLYPTYYINKSNIRKNNSKDPSILKLTFFDTESFDVLNQDDSNYKTIKLISLNLKSSKDLNNVLNLYDKLTKLSELKYIFFKCNFKCTEVQLEELKINNSNLRIFYRIEDPS